MKRILSAAFVFFTAYSLNASDLPSQECHDWGVTYASGMGYTGQQYADAYMEAYDTCEALKQIEEDEIEEPR